MTLHWNFYKYAVWRKWLNSKENTVQWSSATFPAKLQTKDPPVQNERIPNTFLSTSDFESPNLLLQPNYQSNSCPQLDHKNYRKHNFLSILLPSEATHNSPVPQKECFCFLLFSVFFLCHHLTKTVKKWPPSIPTVSILVLKHHLLGRPSSLNNALLFATLTK